NGDNSGTDDFLRVRVVDGTTLTTVFQQTGKAAEVDAAWRQGTADLSAFAGRSVRLLVEATDAGTPSLFEAQVDDLTITTD
ncbi:aminopeptidase, partial [Nonomuraea sp. NPDC005692]